MKKSLIILSIALALVSYESNALNGKARNSHSSKHSSSLDKIEKSSVAVERRALSASIRYSTFLINANSPSTRKNSHWLIDMEEELAPLAPDEMEILAESSIRTSRIEKIRRTERRKNVVVNKENTKKIWYEAMADDAYLEIYVSGGGFKGGVNPKIHDQIMISNSGFIQKYYESEVTGAIEQQKIVDREELFELIQWIAKSGFFEFDRDYSCADGDELCLERMDLSPEPVPLKVVVALGPYRNVITIPIFSPEKANDFIDYPENLRKIVKAIYDFASL